MASGHTSPATSLVSVLLSWLSCQETKLSIDQQHVSSRAAITTIICIHNQLIHGR